MLNQLATISHESSEALSLVEEMFPPTDYDFIEVLISEYETLKHQMLSLANFVKKMDSHAAISHFIEANRDEYARGIFSPERLFNLPPALKSLDAKFWQSAMNKTGIYDLMPESRREGWRKSIDDRQTPEFTEQIVRMTIEDLMASRPLFLAERVDYLFKNLSRNHKTNKAFGFSARMILEYVVDPKWGTTSYSRCGIIHDLRSVISMFIGREPPTYGMADVLVSTARKSTGEWFDVDGGAMRIRVYKKGTAHIEIHPDIAWRLNAILAMLHPNLIPSELRTPTKRKLKKTHNLFSHLIPTAVLDELAKLRFIQNREGMYFDILRIEGKSIRQSLEDIIIQLGGTLTNNTVCFSFNPNDAINEVALSGLIPSYRSYQFYPTPADLAAECVRIAEIDPSGKTLEPSAGHGALAQLLPDDADLVEISELHCLVLKSKGFKNVLAMDFLEFEKKTLSTSVRYRNIVMNPPFSEGRYMSHLQAAASLLAPGGRITAILPSSVQGKNLLPGLVHKTHGPYTNQFANTGIDVVIMTFDDPI